MMTHPSIHSVDALRTGESTLSETYMARVNVVGEMLTLAADRAASHSTVAKAVAAAWSTLHSEGTDAMSSAFAAWCRAEAFDSHPSELGEYLRRHYATPVGVADSLRRAAESVSSTGEEKTDD